MEEALRRSSFQATADVVIQQPFSVNISVQGCSHWRSSRRYFVQVLLRNKAPIPVTLHACRLRLPPSYRTVQEGNQGTRLRDLLLASGQEARYTYLIERLAGAGAGAAAVAGAREAPSKMSVDADYTWESLQPINQARVRRHHPPQQQQNFVRYFQDSAMLNRGDALRTFVVRAQLVPSTSVEGEAGAGDDMLPSCVPATPGDVEERGVVVGHFQNRVTEGVVGVALRLELAVELSEEAAREAAAGAAKGRSPRFRLAYEVAADPADWAVSGVTKGTVEVGPGEEGKAPPPVALECKLVPVRVGLLACPALTFEPVNVRLAVSPKSKRKSNVRWVGPRDIQVLGAGGLKRIPTVRLS